VVGLAGALPGEERVELSPRPVGKEAGAQDHPGEVAEGQYGPEEVEDPDEAVVDETKSEGLHADTTLLVEGGEDGSRTGHAQVEHAGELGFRGGGNEVGVWHS
jgi:hypothetical protein